MALPKINLPEYHTTLPSTGEPVTFKPFLSSHQKVILIAQTTGNKKSIISAIKTIFKDCVKCKTKIEDMSTFDIEFLFLNLRAKSEGEEIKLSLICPDDKKTEVEISINIDDIKVKFDEDHSNIIDLLDDIKVVMRYPNIEIAFSDFISESGDDKESTVAEKYFSIIEYCVKEVYQGDEVYNFQEYSSKDRKAFLESIPAKEYKKLVNFIDTMPVVSHDIEFENPNTKVMNKITLEGMDDFF